LETARPTGRRPGRPDTRADILGAARALFAQRGYSGTSIRAVAAAAGVDPALVHHYFDTKDNLFRTALEVPIRPEELVEQILAAGPEEAPARLVRTFLGVWDDAETGPAMVSFLRTIVAQPGTAAMVGDFFATTVVRMVAQRLLAGVDPAEAGVRVSLVAGQMVGLVLVRRVLAVDPLASMPAEELAAAVTPSVTRYLFGDLSISHDGREATR
jgi:AcrR family transcriptional regulator